MRKLLILSLLGRLASAGQLNIFPDNAAISYSSGWSSTTLQASDTAGDTFAGRTLRNTNVQGASATLTFTGDGVTFVTTNWPDGAFAQLVLDGGVVKIVALQSGDIHRAVQVPVADGLANTQHTLQVVASMSSSAPNQTWCDVEGFIVNQPDAPALVAAPAPVTQTVTESPAAQVIVTSSSNVATALVATAVSVTPVTSSIQLVISSSSVSRGPARLVASQLVQSAALQPAQAVVANSNQTLNAQEVSTGESSNEDGTSPALIPALAATGGVALLCFISLGVLYLIRRRQREETVAGSSLASAWARNEGIFEKMPYEREPSLASDARDGAQDGAWHSFLSRR